MTFLINQNVASGQNFSGRRKKEIHAYNFKTNIYIRHVAASKKQNTVINTAISLGVTARIKYSVRVQNKRRTTA